MIDVHTHCLQHTHWGPEWDANWKPVYQREWVDVLPAAFDDAMADGGVDLAFVFGMRATKQGVKTPNEFVARFCQDTATPTVGFMSLDLSDPDVFDQLADGVANGLRGIKLYPVLAGFDPRDPAHDPFFAEATRLGLVVLWHMGATPSPAGNLSLSNPLLVDDVATRHPDLVPDHRPPRAPVAAGEHRDVPEEPAGVHGRLRVVGAAARRVPRPGQGPGMGGGRPAALRVRLPDVDASGGRGGHPGPGRDRRGRAPEGQ
jgi:hypothetical protein